MHVLEIVGMTMFLDCLGQCLGGSCLAFGGTPTPTRIWEGVDCIVGFFAFSGIEDFGWMLMMLGYVRVVELY